MDRTNWLHSLPPWRMPRIRTHRHHHAETIPVIRWLAVAYVFAIIWCIEFELWLCVWFYYAAFLALRWCWRHNPIGQTIDSRAARRARQQQPAYDPHGAPPQHYDLGNLNQR